MASRAPTSSSPRGLEQVPPRSNCRRPSVHRTNSGGQDVPSFGETQNAGVHSFVISLHPPLQGPSPAGVSAAAATAPAPAPGGGGTGFWPRCPPPPGNLPCIALMFGKWGGVAFLWFQNPETSGLQGIMSLTALPPENPLPTFFLGQGLKARPKPHPHTHQSLSYRVSHQMWVMATCGTPTVWPAVDKQRGQKAAFLGALPIPSRPLSTGAPERWCRNHEKARLPQSAPLALFPAAHRVPM